MIKSKLLASTMLISAAALMATGSANAASLKVGGFAEAWLGIVDPNKAGEKQINNFDIKHDAEIYFRAEETLDNGIKIGYLFEMEAGVGNDNNTDFDESFGWIKTKWGQVNVGNNDVASGYVGSVSVVGPVGINKSDAKDWLPGVDDKLNNTDADVGVSDAQNITYFTPKVGGVQLIVSYTPDSSDGAVSTYDESVVGGFHDAVSGAIKYGAKFGKVGFSLNAGATHVNADDSDASANRDAHSVKAGVKFGPVAVSGAYAKENGDTNNDSFYGAGVIYSAGKKDKFSLGYGHGEKFDKQGSPDEEHDIITVGWSRNLGKGISFAASGFWMEEDTGGSGQQPEGYGLVGGFKLKF